MTLPTSGAISLDNVNFELSRSSSAGVNLNESSVRTLAQKSSGQISLSDLQGKVGIPTTFGDRYYSGDFRDFATNGTTTVLVSSANGIPTIYTSTNPTDSASWTPRFSAASFVSVAWISRFSGFVAVGSGSNIHTSPDGITWTQRTNPTTSAFNRVREIYITGVGNAATAVGFNGTIIYSIDGVTWTTAMSGTTQALYGIAQELTTLAIVVGGNNGTIRYSYGNINSWSASTTGVTNVIMDISCKGSNFIAVTNGGPAALRATNTNLSSWSTVLSGIVNGFSSVGVANNLFIACGYGVVYTSPDSVYWTQRTVTRISNFIRAVSSGGILAGGPTLQITADYNSWRPITNNPRYGLRGIAVRSAESNTLFVAVADLETIITSPDGNNWTTRVTRLAEASIQGGVAISNSILKEFVAPALGGIIFRSTDGVTWSRISIFGVTQRLTGAATNHAGTWVVVGDGGRIVRSTDSGSGWSIVTSPTTEGFRGVLWDGSKFIAYLSLSSQTTYKIYTSTDGVTWNTINTNLGQYMGFISLAWNGSRYVVATQSFMGSSYYVKTSTDLVTWSDVTQFVNSSTSYVIWTGTVFIADNSGHIYTSTNGINWTQRTTTALTISVSGMALAPNRFIITDGNYGGMVMSPPPTTITM